MTHPTVFPTLRYPDAPRATERLVDARDPDGHRRHFGTYQPFDA